MEPSHGIKYRNQTRKTYARYWSIKAWSHCVTSRKNQMLYRGSPLTSLDMFRKYPIVSESRDGRMIFQPMNFFHNKLLLLYFLRVRNTWNRLYLWHLYVGRHSCAVTSYSFGFLLTDLNNVILYNSTECVVILKFMMNWRIWRSRHVLFVIDY